WTSRRSTARSTRSSPRSSEARASSASCAVSSSCTSVARLRARSAGRSWPKPRSASPRSRYHQPCRPGDRGLSLRRRLEESPDTPGQDGRAASLGFAQGGDRGGESRRKVEQKGDRRPRETEAGKGETVG